MRSYDYLNAHFPIFYHLVTGMTNGATGIIVSDGDKFSQYEYEWAKHGISLNHGGMIYLISKESPYNKECRQTDNGFVYVDEWVIANYQRFLPMILIVESLVLREKLKQLPVPCKSVLQNILYGHYDQLIKADVYNAATIALDDIKFLQ